MSKHLNNELQDWMSEWVDGQMRATLISSLLSTSNTPKLTSTSKIFFFFVFGELALFCRQTEKL